MTGSDHLDESALARLLDDQIDDRERAVYRQHVHGCLVCAATLSRLRQQAELVAETLTSTDVAVPVMAVPRGSRRVQLVSVFRYGAAALAASMMFVLAISPVRAWVVDNVAVLSTRLRGSKTQQAVAVRDSAAGSVANRVAISIPISGDLLRIRLTNHQAQGGITVIGADQSVPTAEVIGGLAERLVLADGLVIQNDPNSTASYRVLIPIGMTVELVISDQHVRQITLDESTNSMEIALTPG